MAESEYINEILPEDVEWSWEHPTTGPQKTFEEDVALAHLIINNVVLIGPGTTHGGITASVVCNDIFAWASADAEHLPYTEIEPLYRLWKQNPVWGAGKWCALQRNQRPQRPVIEMMKGNGLWDDAMEALPL